MVDCLSRGRIMAGFARGVPREYKVYDVPMAESRARFDEALDVILAAWTQDVFTHQGRYWSFKDVAIWPRPFQRPHPPVWIAELHDLFSRSVPLRPAPLVLDGGLRQQGQGGGAQEPISTSLTSPRMNR